MRYKTFRKSKQLLVASAAIFSLSLLDRLIVDAYLLLTAQKLKDRAKGPS